MATLNALMVLVQSHIMDKDLEEKGPLAGLPAVTVPSFKQLLLVSSVPRAWWAAHTLRCLGGWAGWLFPPLSPLLAIVRETRDIVERGL